MLHWRNTAKYLLAQRRPREELLKAEMMFRTCGFSLLLIFGTCSRREIIGGGGGGWKEKSALSLCFPCIVPYESISLQPLPSVQTASACEERMADLRFLSSRWGSFLLPL